MKRTTVLYAVTTLAALAFAGQAFAKGGSMGGGQSHGNNGSGTHQMTSTMQTGSGNGMQQRTMPSNASRQGQAAASGAQTKKHSGVGGNAGHKSGPVNGNSTGTATTLPPATTASN